jgi:prepilin-type N-terminal cleavage/methylation domain-containing protein
MQKTNSKGFTLIELLIVIAIIAIIAGVVFVALDPLKRFQDSRDARRWADVSNILSAIKVQQVDNKGPYLPAIVSAVGTSTGFIITKGNSCTTFSCGTIATGTDATRCINLDGLITAGYLGDISKNVSEVGTAYSDSYTGYVLTKYSNGSIKIQSCEVGNATNNPNGIFVTR